MGNCGQKVKTGFKDIFAPKQGQTKIGQAFNCPNCDQHFTTQTTYNILNVHLDTCMNKNNLNTIQQQQLQQNMPLPVLQPQESHNEIRTNVESNNNNQQQQKEQKEDEFLPQPLSLKHFQEQVPQKQTNQSVLINNAPVRSHFYWTKVPTNKEKTQFTWERKASSNTPINQIRGMKINEIKNKQFDVKFEWFRYHLEKLRVPWQQGADWVTIYKDNVLLSSMDAINKCNLHKEIKVKIVGEKVEDAGGVLREWVHLIVKEAFHQDSGLFIMAETEDVTYRINPEAEVDEHVLNCFKLFGKIMGKILFEKFPLTAFVDKTILKFILGQEITLEDIQFFDQQLYRSWSYIKNNDFNEEEFYETFIIYKKNGFKTEMVELKPNGSQITITNQNKEEYVNLCVEYMTKVQIKPFLEAIAEEFYKVVPKDLVQIFEVYEFEMILNSTPFINIEDWKVHTKYDGGYKETSKTIKYFWEVLNTFDQPKLGEFLRYCTGSSRTPIEGFKKLESNRGEYANFCIRQIPFSKKNPYPIAHTCFNRLELPLYTDYEQTKMYLNACVNNDLDGVFGME